MSVRAAVYDLLNDVEADVFPLAAPQETTDPYVVYSIRSNPVRTQDGYIREADLTIDMFASSFTAVSTLSDSMFAGLEGASGTYGSETLIICNWTAEDIGNYIPDLDKYQITQEYNLKFE